jgi:putative restriction endonuclease
MFWENLIKRGRCFVVWESGKGLMVGPSRFVGYVDNDLLKHKVNGEKDGRDTNKALYKLWGRCSPNDALDKEFVVFCSREGIVPSNKQRKYWIA